MIGFKRIEHDFKGGRSALHSTLTPSAIKRPTSESASQISIIKPNTRTLRLQGTTSFKNISPRNKSRAPLLPYIPRKKARRSKYLKILERLA